MPEAFAQAPNGCSDIMPLAICDFRHPRHINLPNGRTLFRIRSFKILDVLLANYFPDK